MTARITVVEAGRRRSGDVARRNSNFSAGSLHSNLAGSCLIFKSKDLQQKPFFLFADQPRTACRKYFRTPYFRTPYFRTPYSVPRLESLIILVFDRITGQDRGYGRATGHMTGTTSVSQPLAYDGREPRGVATQIRRPSSRDSHPRLPHWAQTDSGWRRLRQVQTFTGQELSCDSCELLLTCGSRTRPILPCDIAPGCAPSVPDRGRTVLLQRTAP